MKRQPILDFFDISSNVEELPRNELFRLRGGYSDGTIDGGELPGVDVPPPPGSPDPDDDPWDWGGDDPHDGWDDENSDMGGGSDTGGSGYGGGGTIYTPPPTSNPEPEEGVAQQNIDIEKLTNALKAVYETKTSPNLQEMGISPSQYIADWIGGKVQYNFNNDPDYRDTCALTLSLVLNLMGDGYNIEYTEGQTSSGDFNRNGENEWYFYRAEDMQDYLTSKYGNAVEVGHIDNIPDGAQGFLYYEQFEGYDRNYNHVDYWDGGSVMGGTDYSNAGGKVYFIRTN
ncbi:hypothetical protein FXV77_21350 [Sphingobacterium phlebotomi]|uniref:Type VI secretion system (T6SS) effector Tae4 (Amidase) n=1 Tax=Sphingobacterium phlebotomi TaxID=2605433 RepID=A0A5D4GT52_9SPHI|nr:T6SS effector amidase Tae4 family protein [Sphingobacterium phlebotomi]TYR31242.1 hypothetical protein FXV77_21350 [Sphingobacterium phlebotomi]